MASGVVVAFALGCILFVRHGVKASMDGHALLATDNGARARPSPGDTCLKQVSGGKVLEAMARVADHIYPCNTGDSMRHPASHRRDTQNAQPALQRWSVGKTVMSVRLQHHVSALRRPERSFTTRARFDHLEASGSWSLSEQFAGGRPRWLILADNANLPLGFRVRSFRLNGKLTANVCTFGAQSNPRNYAIPCVDLLWNGMWWTAPANGYAWAGHGGDVMGVLWLDIDETLGYDAQKASLQCRLTVDDAEDPREVIWQIVNHCGMDVLSIRLARVGDELGGSSVVSVSIGRFEHLAQTGAWSPSDRSTHSDLRWFGLASGARLVLGFQRRQFRENGRWTPRRFTFGAHASRAHYAIPCADLHWDGRSLVGKVTWEAWKGDGGAVMDALKQEIQRHMNEEIADVVSLHCQLAIDDFEDPSEVVWQILHGGGAAVVKFHLARGGGNLPSPRNMSEELAHFEQLARTGSWSPSNPNAHGGLQWFVLARRARLALCFQRRRFCKNGEQTPRRFTFGAHANKAHYAIPCADLRWDGRSLIGTVTWEAWKGEGGAVMDALKQEIQRHMDEKVAGDVRLHCVLTIDDLEDPSEVVWQIVRSGGEAVVIVRLHRGGGNLPGPRGMSEERAHFERLAQRGTWSPSDSNAKSDLQWFVLARRARLALGFQRRQFRENGRHASNRFTFGAHASKAHYAIPCADLRWDGRSLVGKVTWEACKGDGRAVMEELKQDIWRHMDEEIAEDVVLQCVLIFDDIKEPTEVVWQIVRSGGEAVVSVHMHLEGLYLPSPHSMSAAHAYFEHLAHMGSWSPSDSNRDVHWLVLARRAHLALGFQRRQFRENGRHTPLRSTFGAHASRAHYAIPCADLRWDGRSFVGSATWDAWKGDGGAVMEELKQEIWRHMDEEIVEDVVLQCVLTIDDLQNPSDVVWRIVRLGGEAVFSIHLERGGGNPSSSHDTSAARARFEHLAQRGTWTPSDLNAISDLRWFGLASGARLALGFQRRQFRENGRMMPRRFTFGAHVSRAHYAIPCADLRWDGRSLIGNLTWEAWKGDGGAVMDALKQEIRRHMDEEIAKDAVLQCVLTIDDLEDPREVVWQIAQPGDGLF